MKIRDLIPLSYKALLVNKARTILTMLGIIIGIASVILMVTVGQAAQGYLLNQVANFGSDFIAVESGQGDQTRGGPPPTTRQTLTLKDYTKLKDLSWPVAVTAQAISRDLVSFGGVDTLTQVTGAGSEDMQVFNETLKKGNYFSDEDINSHTRVVVLGSKVADKLFGQEDPIGKTIKITRQPFRVMGVLDPAGTRFFSDADDQVYIPVTAALDLYNKTHVDYIGIKAGDRISINQAKELVRIELRATHNISNPNGDLSKDDFQVTTQEDSIKTIAVIGLVLQILLGSIAGISLLVAGIGIMNIMYVTVTERTREIGLRKAIGAHRGDILGQFLTESILLTVGAGILGILLGISVSWLAIQAISYYQAGWTFLIPWEGAGIGFGVSATIGIFFGYFPARRAARLNPIEALRYE